MAHKAGNLNWNRCCRALAYGAIALCSMLRASIAEAYVPDDRWAVTASGATGGTGTPVTLTWSFAPDGTQIPSEGASNFISYFDGLFNVTSGGSDLTQRPWFSLFEDSFDRWSEVGGITFKYEPNDSGSILNTSAGVVGVRGDVRIGGAFVDGANGTLAYTWLPDSGDMVIDTGETGFYSNSSNNYRSLRNTVMHELGHAFGLLHIESSTDALLMEPFINSSFDGPQLDDIRGIQGLYGDPLEKTNNGLGNGTPLRAFHLGLLASGALDIGSDATGTQVVAATETDFVSIANSTDIDFYSFDIVAPSLLDITLTPLGGVFNQGVEGGVQSQFNANARSDLTLAVFASNGTTLLGSANLDGAGAVESLIDLALNSAGKYFARVTGAAANVQMYQLQLSATLIPVTLAGDYNEDGTVDAADYAVWRDSLGISGTGLAADGSRNGLIDAADYDIWKNNFGATSGSGLPAQGGVPEPSGFMLLLLGSAATSLVRMRRTA
jgi:serralysin